MMNTVTSFARRTVAFCAAAGLALTVGIAHTDYARADVASVTNPQAELAAAQAELKAAQSALTTAEKNFASVKTLKAKVDAVNKQAGTSAGIANDFAFSGQTPFYVPVNGSTKRSFSASTLVGVKGSYVTSQGGYTQASLLAYINKIRMEAWQEGLIPRKPNTLTWDKGLERSAQVRAAEISIYGDHTRPASTRWYSVDQEGLAVPYAENLSWGSTYFGNLEMWVDEKADYIKMLNCNKGDKSQCNYGQTGHYVNLINPSYTTIGIAQFETDRSSVNPYGTAMAAELSYVATKTGSKDVKPASKTIFQGVYAQTSALGSVSASGATQLNVAKVSNGYPVFYRNPTVYEAKKLAKSQASQEWSRISADYTAKNNAVTAAQKRVTTAQARVAAAQKKLGITPTPTATAKPQTTSPAPKPTSDQNSKTVDMLRLYNPATGEHFYTSDVNEKNTLVSKHGWKYERVAWVAPKTSKSPVYRLYNPALGDHHYTMNAGEKDALKKHGWKYEGISWYSDDDKHVPVWRAYNKALRVGSHHYTTDTGEYKALTTKHGWQPEGIAWYAVK